MKICKQHLMDFLHDPDADALGPGDTFTIVTAGDDQCSTCAYAGEGGEQSLFTEVYQGPGSTVIRTD